MICISTILFAAGNILKYDYPADTCINSTLFFIICNELRSNAPGVQKNKEKYFYNFFSCIVISIGK